MNWRLFLLIFLFPAFLAAQTAPPVPVLPPVPKLELRPIPPGADKIVPLPKGAEAPFSGQLFDPSTALRWGNYLEQYHIYHGHVVDTQRQIYLLELNHQLKVFELERKAHNKIEVDLKSRLAKSEAQRLEASSVPWYDGRTFGIILGTACTLLIVGLSAYSLGKVK